MDDVKTIISSLLNKQKNRQVKIPEIGFSDYFVYIVTAESNGSSKIQKSIEDSIDTMETKCTKEDEQESDQEIIEKIQEQYFKNENDLETYELQSVLSNGINDEIINKKISQLKNQHKVLSKQVLQKILVQQHICNAEFSTINVIKKKLNELVWTCQKVRSYLSYAKTNLTTSSLRLLASYQKRESLNKVLEILLSIKNLKSTNSEIQRLLECFDFPGAISLLLHCKDASNEYMQFDCVQSLNKRLQETITLTEYQLDKVMSEITLNFHVHRYAKLQDAYRLLNKTLISMDQLHINFISTIHSSANSIVRTYSSKSSAFNNCKCLYEQLCEQISTENYIPCLMSLCKTIWTILSSYYQIATWHQKYKLYPLDLEGSMDFYIQEKVIKGRSRIWNDIITKICIYLQSEKVRTLKYDQFIQVISIVQRLKKIGIEFCGEQSEKLIETMQLQGEAFFKLYHISCLEEICLFLDNESWAVIDSFKNILQLPEFGALQHAVRRQKLTQSNIPSWDSVESSPKKNNNNCDEIVTLPSDDENSTGYGTYGYFSRFSEKISPFDGGLDIFMIEEDILSEIIYENSCLYSEENFDEQMKDFVCDNEIFNNTTLNIFRCIGRYLQMCTLLPCISPIIVANTLELIDFYGYAVVEIFGKDSTLELRGLNTTRLECRLQAVHEKTITQIKIWPLNFSSLVNNELANPDTLYGLTRRIVAIESGHYMLHQFKTLHYYLYHLLQAKDRSLLLGFMDDIQFMEDISQLVYFCVTSRVIDSQTIIKMILREKWDTNHISFHHSSYIDVMNRNIQSFMMRLEDFPKDVIVPTKQIWNTMAHASTFVLIEGYSSIKKCSAGGRALMQLDFTNFMAMLEMISNQKYPTHHATVDNFIKAYYFSNEQFEEWVNHEMNGYKYSIKQLANLIQCVCVSDKRIRQKLLNLLRSSSNADILTKKYLA